MKIKKCAKRAIVMVCAICMLLSPMSAMADGTMPQETEPETSELETESSFETESESETESETEAESGTEVESETETETDEFDIEGDGQRKVGVKTRKTAMLLNSTGATIDISQYDGIKIDSSNVDEYDNKTITGKLASEKNLIITGGVTVHLTIKDLEIDKWNASNSDGCYDAVIIEGGSTLYLTLEGDNVLKGNDLNGGAGIRVEAGNTLIITEDSTGTLTAIGGNGRGAAAGIGSGNCEYSSGESATRTTTLGTIVINGGTINAQGGASWRDGSVVLASAGIGLSSNGAPGSGSITVNGGKVTATGGRDDGAGIGGGEGSYVGSITISGGEVTAIPGQYAAAIGTGYNGENTKIQCGNIAITGGKVIAKGNIGYGESHYSDVFGDGLVNIEEGATVTVTSGEIKCDNKEVADGTITQKYTLTVTVKNPTYTDGTKSGHITIGAHDDISEDITFNLGDGKATATVDIETTLSGEQPVKVSIDGTNLEDKTILLGTENEIVFGGEQGFSLAEVSGVTCRYANGILTIGGNGTATISMADGVETTTDCIVVENDADVKLTLNNLSIDSTEKMKGAITIGQTGGTAKCELIPVGECTLTREDSIEGGVIEVGDCSSLTIGGNGKLIIRGKAATVSADPRRYSAGIYAVNGNVVIEDNPSIDIRATGEVNDDGIVKGYMVCIYSKKVNINGGQINARPGANGHGIGYPFYMTRDTEKGDVTITGGTIYAEGGYGNYNNGGITGVYTRVKIDGGNVNMNKLARSNVGELQPPVNSNNDSVYCTTITVGKADDDGKNTLSTNAKVNSLTIKLNGKDYSYGIDGMYTDAEGKLYLWLPKGSIVSGVVTENGSYSGECTTNSECTKNPTSGNANYMGNSFGTAEATFTIAAESEFHKFTKKVKSAAALKSAGTCKRKAVYYYTCECEGCNEISTDKTFEGDIDPNNHVNTEIRGKIDPVHATQTDGYSGDTYCKDCGKKLEQGQVVKVTPHTSLDWLHSDTEHWKVCTVEGCGVEIAGSRAVHSSTRKEHKATCRKAAVCDVCGVTYGGVISHQYTAKIKSVDALKSPATATEEAVYYYSCSMCGAVEENDEHTFVDHHEPEKNHTPSGHTSADSTPEDSTPATLTSAAKAPASVASASNGNQPLKRDISAGNRQMAEDTKQNNVGEQIASENAEQSQTDALQNIVSLTDEMQTRGNIIESEKTSDVTNSDETDTDATQEKTNMRRIAIVSSTIVGSSVVSGGVYIFFRRKRMLEKILKGLFKK